MTFLTDVETGNKADGSPYSYLPGVCRTQQTCHLFYGRGPTRADHHLTLPVSVSIGRARRQDIVLWWAPLRTTRPPYSYDVLNPAVSLPRGRRCCIRYTAPTLRDGRAGRFDLQPGRWLTGGTTELLTLLATADPTDAALRGGIATPDPTSVTHFTGYRAIQQQR